jgi:hypothetical protein
MKAVTFFRVVPILLFLVLTICVDSMAATSSKGPKVKLSSSGICHDQSSASFNRTKHYQAFDTVVNCIAQGGRLPKAKTKAIDKATDAAIEQGRAFVMLYDRSDWPHWLDSDKDCQNTRHEMLIQTSTKAITFTSEKQCNVLSGQWYDPYSSETFTQSTDLDLDHIVPLKFAHERGGSSWSREQKALFANDSENLMLAQASLNRQKGAKGLNDWLPPNHQYRCKYIAHFNKVMSKYDLAYIPPEQRIVNRLVKACSKVI